MSAVLFALALFAQDAAEPAPQAPTAAEAAFPPGAPRDDYGLVSWCYGALRGYLDLHDQAMPEVTRIESTYRRPGSKLSDDLKVYADLQREGQANLKLFARAMEAAERASLRPINAAGAAAVKKGRANWAAAPNMTKARLAQEWMSWALPAKCISTAHALEQRAKLQGPAFQVNTPADETPAEAAPAEPAPTIDGLLQDSAPQEAPAAQDTAAAPSEAPAQP